MALGVPSLEEALDRARALQSYTKLQDDRLVSSGWVPVRQDRQDDHFAALGAFLTRMDALAEHPPDHDRLRADLQRRMAVPGLHVRRAVTPTPHPQPMFAWIDPARVTWLHPARFVPNNGREHDMVPFTLRTLEARESPDEVARLLGFGQRVHENIVLLTMPGPRGPMHQVIRDGHHRSVALAALGVPLVLAKVTRSDAPYVLRVERHRLRSTRRLLDDLRRADAVAVAEILPRSPEQSPTVERLAVPTPAAPWLLGPPEHVAHDARVYEQLAGPTSYGGLTTAELLARCEPSSVAKAWDRLARRALRRRVDG